jgi:hypothetical protein
MAPSEDTAADAAESASPTGIQASEPVAVSETGIQTPQSEPIKDSIPLPSVPAASPTVQQTSFPLLDGLLVLLVVVLGFLCASFPIANSDFFRQLATGKLLSQGEYRFGDDPFIWANDGSAWINHSWLFGLVVHYLHEVPGIGGVLLIGLKGVLVALLAAMMILLGRRGDRGLALSAACAGLALVVISPRLIFQPSCVSIFFLGLTLWLVRSPRLRASTTTDATGNAPSFLSFYLLPLLFAVWVNVDSWFLLGPLVTALYLMGEWLGLRFAPSAGPDQPDQPAPGELRALGIALAAGIVACLANPFGWHAFTLPEQLGLARGFQLAGEVNLSISPLVNWYFLREVGYHPAGLAYFPLLLITAVSFVLASAPPGGRRVLIGWRLFVTLPLAVLSMYTMRAIPFFAVVAAPVSALNFLDILSHPAFAARGKRGLAISLRVLALVSGLAALAAAMPGWLQGKPHTYHIGWQVRPDTALKQAAEKIRAWREQGLAPADTRWFNLSPEVANYVACYAPGERVFVDHRYALSDDDARDLAAVRRALAGRDQIEAPQGAPPRDPAWRAVFRARGVQFLILLTDPLGSNLGEQLAPGGITALRLMAEPSEWTTCYVNGRAGVFGWIDPSAPKDPQGQDLFAKVRFDFKREAFGPHVEPLPEAALAPSETRQWWADLWDPPPPPSDDTCLGILFGQRFEAFKPAYQLRHRTEWETYVTTWLVGQSAVAGGPAMNGSLIPAQLSLAYRVLHGDAIPEEKLPVHFAARQLHDLYLIKKDAGPPESLYLSIRALRRALAANPEDPQPYYWLGRTYYQLGLETQERVLTSALPRIAEIRRTQILAAFQAALKRRLPPTQAEDARQILANTFSNAPVPLWDEAAKNAREWLRLKEARLKKSARDPKDIAQELEQSAEQVEKMEANVKRAQDQYEISAANKPVLQKVQLALQNHLAEPALKVMTNDPEWTELLKQERTRVIAIELLLDLYLNTGQLDDAQQILEPEGDKAVDPVVVAQHISSYIRWAAAAGEYSQAEQFLARTIPAGAKPALNARLVAAQVIGSYILAAAPRAAAVPFWLPLSRNPQGQLTPSVDWQPVAIAISITVLEAIQNEAGVYLLRGLLALEAGRVADAEMFFRTAETLVVPDDRWVPLLFSLRAMIPQEVLRQLFVSLRPAQAQAGALAKRCLTWIAEARQ